MAWLAGAAAGVALFDYLAGNQQKLSITDTITTDMTINATTNINTTCFAELDASQTIDVNSGTGDNFDTYGPTACTACLDAINAIYTARNALETQAALQNPAYTPQVANPSLQTIMITGGSDPSATGALSPQSSATWDGLGPCTALCSDIVIVNVAQSAKLSATTTCGVDDTVTNKIAQSVQGQISAYLKNQQDIVGQIEGSLISNTESISANLATTMVQNVTSNFIQSLHQTMKAFQSIEVTGHSVLMDGVTQGFTGSMVGNLQVNNTVTDQLRQSAQYSIAQTLLNKNDTLSDITQAFLKTLQTIDELIEDVSTDILIIVACMVGCVILVVGALYIFNKQFHMWFNNKLQTVADAKIQHITRMQNDPAYRQQVAAAKSADLANKQKEYDLANKQKEYDLANKQKEYDLANKQKEYDRANKQKEYDQANKQTKSTKSWYSGSWGNSSVSWIPTPHCTIL